MRQSKLSLFIIIGSTLVFFSCKKETQPENKTNELTVSKEVPAKANQDNKYNTFYGPQVEVGNGLARTFATISHTGVPKEVGIIFTDEALPDMSAENALYRLEFHHKATEATPFTHVVL